MEFRSLMFRQPLMWRKRRMRKQKNGSMEWMVLLPLLPFRG